MTDTDTVLNLFTGRWIGATQGATMPAHVWEIARQGNGLSLATRWEGETRVIRFQCRLVADEQAFLIQGNNPVKVILVDKQHFVVPAWCTNDARGGVGPHFDVVFSRPGIAELTAETAYRRYLELTGNEGDQDSALNRTTSPKGN